MIAAVAACGGANVRPTFGPLPDAAVDTVRAAPATLIGRLEGLVTAQGLRIARASAAEGYLETGWYDVAAARPGGRYTLHPTRIIRLRFFVDDAGGGNARLVSEAVYRITVDPSLPVRDAEVIVPPDHPGAAILRAIRDGISRRVP